MSDELKPCPFCGGEAEITKWHEGYFVECKAHHCGGTIGAYKTEEETIEAWNTRAERTCEMPMVFEDDEGNELDSSAAYFRYYRCSNCGEIMEHYKHEHWSYCPNCGAKVIDDEG